MSTYSLDFIQNALRKRQVLEQGQMPAQATGVSIDTRTLQPGNLFFALLGETHDGHEFVASAFEQGAAAAVVSHNFDGFAPDDARPLIKVNDTLLAFHDLARAHLKANPMKRVALTGSSGKTTTKELIREALAACFGDRAVFASSGNQNNHFGVPLSVFKTTPEHEVAIFEMGMNQFGEIALLADLVKPHIGLITNMGLAHSGNLGGPEGVAKAKSELFEALGENDIALVNVDDPRCMREAEAKVKGKKITFGRANWADVRASNIESGADGLKLNLTYKGETYPAFIPLLGAHNAYNATAACAVAAALEIDFAKAVAGLANIKSVKGRLQKHVLASGAILLDDTYNANPESMEAGLNVLSSWQDRRRVAILGSMVELGAEASAMHHALGAACAQKQIDVIFACGENGQSYGEGAVEAGFAPQNFHWAKDSRALADVVASQIFGNDAVLVKGSRLMQMEKVVERLLRA